MKNIKGFEEMFEGNKEITQKEWFSELSTKRLLVLRDVQMCNYPVNIGDDTGANKNLSNPHEKKYKIDQKLLREELAKREHVDNKSKRNKKSDSQNFYTPDGKVKNEAKTIKTFEQMFEAVPDNKIKQEIIQILISEQESCKIGSDGDYSSELCVFADDYDLVANKIVTYIQTLIK